MNPLRIVFAGTPAFGVPCLDALHASPHELVAIYTQPDRPAGRGRKLQASAVKSWALEHNIPVQQPLNFRDENTVAQLAALQPDILIVIAYGLILPASVLAIPRLGCVNVHASLLPAYRGASPIQQSILHGDAITGVTIMQMDVGLDTGDMLHQAICEITPHDTAETLHDKLAQLSAKPLLETIQALAAGTANPEKQDNARATYAHKIEKEHALINWHHSAASIDCQIRAFNPWPIAWTQANDEILRIHQAVLTDKTCNDCKPGTILAIDKNGITVATGDSVMVLQKIQFPGGKVLAVSDWLNAAKKTLFPGLILQ